jgi:hypothetical protein
VADHWEPKWSRPPRQVERDRVARWSQEYPRLAQAFADSLGRPPQHSFFYPQEEYEPEHLDALVTICRQGLGDVEVHLHHDNDTADGLCEKLCRFTAALHERHGLLRRDTQGRIRYAFIHGNWALDNSRPDGRWCGVNNELSILIETGCYADLTMPSAPAPCQTRTVNSIYYATDDPARPKSHDRGVAARVGSRQPSDSLLMIQGPLALDFRQRKWGLLPRIENGDLTARRPPTAERLALWIGAGVSVAGKPDWQFVKLHTHGAQEANAEMLLGEPMRRFHASLAELAARDEGFRYYYVTAWELASLVLAAEAGATDPAAVLAAARAAGGDQDSVRTGLCETNAQYSHKSYTILSPPAISKGALTSDG